MICLAKRGIYLKSLDQLSASSILGCSGFTIDNNKSMSGVSPWVHDLEEKQLLSLGLLQV
jgi:hypothetical protein